MIPNRLFFIWFGAKFPFANLLALRSARHGFRPTEILLIVDDPDGIRDKLGEAAAWPELRLLKADASWFDGLPHGVDAIARDLFATGLSPATKANLIRLAALYKLGGVYLDFDTITLHDADDTAGRNPARLLDRSGFCGAEPLALPADLFASRNPLRWAAAGARLAARQAFAYIPGGWRAFRAIEGLYPASPNNAVMGAEAGHPFLDLCFRMMTELSPEERVKRFRLGTHLLQRAAARAAREGALKGFEVLPPAHFYPLGPEVAAHWFKRGTARRLDAMLRPETTVVHWYNSVESRLWGRALTTEWLARNPDTAFAEMVRRYC
jgi:hypothetical protein